MLILFLILIVLALVILIANIAIVPQAYSYVVERLGVYYTTWEAGFHFKTPFVTRIAKKVSLKEQVVDFKPQPVYLIILPSTRLIPRNPIYIRKYTNTLPVNSPMPMSSLLNQPAKIKKKPSLSAA